MTEKNNAPPEDTGKLLAEIRYACQNGQGDTIRKDVYQLARLGQLQTSHILLLRLVRNEESRTK